MCFVRLLAILLSAYVFACMAPANAKAGHTGPDYDIPSGCTPDNGSRTRDSSDGSKIEFTDRFNQVHTVELGPGQEITLNVPITNGELRFRDDDWERIGFNQNVAWAVLKIRRNDDDLEIVSVGWLPPGIPPSPGLIDEIKSFANKAADIVAAGARTVEEAKKIAAAAGLLK